MKLNVILMLACFAISLQQLSAQSVTAEINVASDVKRVPQNDISVDFAATITQKDMTEMLTIIASDDFEGRETATKGLEEAAKYISKRFQQMGIKPLKQLDGKYTQAVPFERVKWGNMKLSVNGQDYKHMRDFYAFAGSNQSAAAFTTKDVVFAGYGVADDKYNDYAGLDVKGKVVMIYRGEPKDGNGDYLISGSTKRSKWSRDYRSKLRAAQKAGVKTVLFIEPNTLKNINRFGNWLIEPSLSVVKDGKKEIKYANHLFISPEIAKAIVGKKYKKMIKARKKIEKKRSPQSFSFPTDLMIQQEKDVQSINSYNILGFIEGVDPNINDEVVVLTAHYDHLGKRGDDIFNGADDNGSGTTTLLEVAEAFQAAKKAGAGPRRSVLVMLLCGEEKGLLGSEYYVNHPVFPLEKTVVDINVDMVGRVDKKHTDNPNYIYVIGSDRLSTELHAINEEMNQRFVGLDLDYTYNAEDDPNRYYYRSDHYNFAEKGIPAIFYFNGTHKDYHRATDTVEKINFTKMEKIGRLVFHTAWELANRDKRIEVDVKGK